MMDPKASAKAKRSHSQHGRRSHPSPATIAQKKKATQAASEDKIKQQHSHALPSNWGRYDDGVEEVESGDGTTSAEGEIAPKSKGADFTYLIEQARSQQHVLRAPAAPEFPSLFDELTIDFMQIGSSISTARGKHLLSQCEDDNFVIDDDLTSSYDVPFLNLDLHTLAAQLSKLKLSERLFIEEDLLPEDLRSDESKGSSTSVESERVGKLEVGQNLGAPNSNPSYSVKGVTGQTEDNNMSAIPYSDFPQTSASHGNLQETVGVANLGELCNRREPEESVTNMSKVATLKTEEAEAELDMLLESCNKTTLSGSIQVDLVGKKHASKISLAESVPILRKSSLKNPGYVNRKPSTEAELGMLLDSSNDTVLFSGEQGTLLDDSFNTRAPNFNVLHPMHQTSRGGAHVSSRNTESTSLDDSLDDLLAETSSIPKLQQHMAAPARQLGSMSSTIDYRNPRSGSSSIKDLLANTSKSIGGQKSAATPNKAASSMDSSSNLDSKAPIDDFDSWINTF